MLSEIENLYNSDIHPFSLSGPAIAGCQTASEQRAQRPQKATEREITRQSG